MKETARKSIELYKKSNSVSQIEYKSEELRPAMGKRDQRSTNRERIMVSKLINDSEEDSDKEAPSALLEKSHQSNL